MLSNRRSFAVDLAVQSYPVVTDCTQRQGNNNACSAFIQTGLLKNDVNPNAPSLYTHTVLTGMSVNCQRACAIDLSNHISLTRVSQGTSDFCPSFAVNLSEDVF